MHASRPKIGIIGLGYVGLPLAVELGKIRAVVGFDINETRIGELRNSIDRTHEVDANELAEAAHLTFNSDPNDLADCAIYIVTVPVLEAASGLKFNQDFFCGYSPERINPGDKTHRLPNILKVTSGSTPETAEAVDALYREIITAGTFKAESIKVAEAAKVIENTQRDLNIALINELAIIFNKMDINTSKVLEAAGTKWNFLPFKPGLVGGHCIGVDPYYLTHKAEAIGYHPQVILAGRRINDDMGGFVAATLVKRMLKECIQVNGSRVLILGLAFKEDCPDLRNTRVIDVIKGLEEFGVTVDVHDPMVDADEAKREYGLDLVAQPEVGVYDAVIGAVAHASFCSAGIGWTRALSKTDAVIYDLKGMFADGEADLTL